MEIIKKSDNLDTCYINFFIVAINNIFLSLERSLLFGIISENRKSGRIWPHNQAPFFAGPDDRARPHRQN
jgi:hypothetical protein